MCLYLGNNETSLLVVSLTLKRQQKTIFPYRYLFTFAGKQQPCGYELRASRSEQMLITHSSLLTAKKISFNVAGMKLFLNIAT